MSDFPERVAIRNAVGVHAARTVPHGDARFTACGLTVDRRDTSLEQATEVTCWGCRRELDAATQSRQVRARPSVTP